jgi:hypothetical protein
MASAIRGLEFLKKMKWTGLTGFTRLRPCWFTQFNPVNPVNPVEFSLFVMGSLETNLSWRPGVSGSY